MKMYYLKITDTYRTFFGNKMEFNERQIKAVMYVKEKGKITNMEYQNFELVRAKKGLKGNSNGLNGKKEQEREFNMFYQAIKTPKAL
jgi:hypothetical protein